MGDLTPGNATNSGVFGANELGQADGQIEIPTSDPNGEDFCAYGTNRICLPFMWQNGALTLLATLGGNNGTVGQINSHGQIIGVSETATKDKSCVAPQVLDYEAVIWGPKPGQIQQLNPLPGDTVGMALWINDNGQAAGASGSCRNSLPPPLALAEHAVVWDADGTVHDLGNLGGTSNAALGVGNVALGINNRGEAVGGSDLAGDMANHAFLWTRESGMQDLGAVSGDTNSTALGINDRGEIVGVSYGPDGPFNGDSRAFLRQNGVMYDLNALIPAGSPLHLLFAGVINSSGQISGFGVTDDGDIHGFLATPSSGPDASESLSSAARLVTGAPALSDEARKLLRRLLRIGPRRPRFR